MKKKEWKSWWNRFAWELPCLFDMDPGLELYEYTKITADILQYAAVNEQAWAIREGLA